MELLSAAWDLLIFKPMLNGLILIYKGLFSNFGITIIVFTVIIRLLILPLTMRQLHASKAMTSIQPKLQELQRRYKGDRQKISQETMRLYKEHGVNPMGCLWPTLVQFPIWIGLYQSILQALAASPDGLLKLSTNLYSWLPVVQQTVPLGSHFLWLDLSQPDPYYVLPILVMVSMYVQQKMMVMPSADPKQASMNSSMQWMMTIMFGYFTILFASGLALYWLVSNIIGIAMQYSVTGWGTLFAKAPMAQPRRGVKPLPATLPDQDATFPVGSLAPKAKKRRRDGKPRGKRKVRG